MQRRPPLLPGGPSGGHGHSHGGIPGGGNKVSNSLQLDYDRRRKVAIKCLELEEMLMSQGFSQQEIEAKVTSFRNLLLVRQATATAAAVHGAQGLQAVTNPAAAALAAITAAAQLASQHSGGHRGHGTSQHQLASAIRNSAAAATLATNVANAANAFTQKPSNAILNLRLNQQLHQQRLSNAILTGQMPSGSTYRRGVLAHDVYAIRKREGSSESEYNSHRRSSRKRRRGRKGRDHRHGRHESRSKSSHRHSRRKRRFSGSRDDGRNSKSSRYRRGSRSPQSRSRSRTPHSSPNRSKTNMKISPRDATRQGKIASHSASKSNISNVIPSNSQKKGPNIQNKSQVFNKSGPKDGTSNSNVNTSDHNSPKKEVYKSSFQAIEDSNDKKNNEPAVEKRDQEKENGKCNDIPRKRRGPLLPLPSMSPKEDIASQSKLNLNPSLVAKESQSVEKNLNAKESHENVHTETEPTASVSNESRQDKRVETRNSGSHKVKDRKKKKKKRSRNSSRRSRTRSRSRSISSHGRSGYRSEKKRKRKKRNRSRSRSTSRRSGRDSSKVSRRSGGKKQVVKSTDKKASKDKDKHSEKKDVSDTDLIQENRVNEYTSEDSKKIVISSIEDIPVVDANEQTTANENGHEYVDNNEKEEVDDDAKALAEIEKEGEAYNARQKKKSNFSFEILSSKSARLRHLIQMNNSNKANNNGMIKDFESAEKSNSNALDKTSVISESPPKAETNSLLSKNSENTQKNDKTADSPTREKKQQKLERTSRFGPSITSPENTSANSNLKYPKFLPKSNNSSGLLATPENKTTPLATAKYYSKDGLADVETDSLGRVRRKRHQRSRSQSHDSRSRSRSYSYSSYSRSRSRSRSRGYGRRSCSRSYSRSWSRSRSRSPSIPRRQGSPSFLDKRRITSARKRPIPYKRKTKFYYEDSPYCSTCSESSRSSWSRSRSRSRSWSRSYSRSPRSQSRSRSRSRSSYNSRNRSGGGLDLREERWSSRSRSRSFSP